MSNTPYEEWIDRDALMRRFSNTRHEHVDELGWFSDYRDSNELLQNVIILTHGGTI